MRGNYNVLFGFFFFSFLFLFIVTIFFSVAFRNRGMFREPRVIVVTGDAACYTVPSLEHRAGVRVVGCNTFLAYASC